MSDWLGAPLRAIDELTAFDAMRRFLEAYWERGGKQSDDIAVLLGSLNRDAWENKMPLDRAQWDEWRDAVDTVLEKFQSPFPHGEPVEKPA